MKPMTENDIFVIYHDETTRTHRSKTRKDWWKTERAAKAELTRAKLDPDVWKIAPRSLFITTIELNVRRRNIMSGNWFTESVNTPGFLSPSSEAYWSM